MATFRIVKDDNNGYSTFDLFHGTLAEAEAEAHAEYKDDFRDHTLQIVEADTREVLSSKLVKDHEWSRSDIAYLYE